MLWSQVLEMTIDEDYSTQDIKEFFRVMQLNAPHLSSQLNSFG